VVEYLPGFVNASRSKMVGERTPGEGYGYSIIKLVRTKKRHSNRKGVVKIQGTEGASEYGYQRKKKEGGMLGKQDKGETGVDLLPWVKMGT